MGDEDEIDVDDTSGYEKSRYMSHLIELGRPCIGVITCRIGTHTCRIGDGQLTPTQNSLKSQFLMMISPVPSHLSLSCTEFYHYLRTRS